MKNGPSWIDDFSGGVIQHLPPTKLPTTVSPRAYNTALRAVQGGNLLVSKRPGCAVAARTTGAVNSQIIASAFFNYEESGTISTHHIGMDSDGKLWDLQSGTSVQLTVPTGTFGFASSTFTVSQGVVFIQGNNQLYGICRGSVAFKVYRLPSDSTLYVGPLGIPAPAAPSYNTEIAGNLNGTIDVRCTYYNSRTGVESNASETLSRPVVNKTLRVNLPTTGPGEVDKVRVYLRKQELQSTFTRNTSMEVAIGTSTIDLSFTDIELNQQILKSPSTTENTPPASGMICGWWHLSRLFLSDGKFLYYSKIGNGDQFNPEIKENPGRGDGQRVAALRSIGDQVLAIFKERSIWGLVGDSTANWQLTLLNGTRGCNSTFSVVEGDNLIGFWSENGPCVWDKQSDPHLLVNETLAPFVQKNLLYVNRRDKAKGVFDPIGHRFLWTADPVTPSTWAWTLLPWSTRHKSWEALGWDLPGPIGAFTVGPSSYGELRVFFGGPNRLMYEMSERYRSDGGAEATTAWTTVSATGTVNGCSVADGSLTVNPDLSVVRIISLADLTVHRTTYSKVGSALTFTTACPFVPQALDLVVFDCPVAEYETPSIQEGAPSQRHRLLQTYLEAWCNTDARVSLALFRDNEQVPLRTWTTVIARNNFTTDGVTTTVQGAVVRHKRWAGFLCLEHRFRILLWDANADLALARIGWTTDIQGDED